LEIGHRQSVIERIDPRNKKPDFKPGFFIFVLPPITSLA